MKGQEEERVIKTPRVLGNLPGGKNSPTPETNLLGTSRAGGDCNIAGGLPSIAGATIMI